MSGLEGRELLSAVPVAHGGAAPPLHALRARRHAPFPPKSVTPAAPSGDFGTVAQPTLVRHPDPPQAGDAFWRSAQEYSYGGDVRDRFYLIRQPGSDRLAFFIHGGGFIGGTASGAYNSPVLQKLWSEGYTIASIEYPLLGDAAWPGPVWAIASGIIAADRVAGAGISHRIIVGESAGATAGALALYSSDPRYPSLPMRIDAFVGASGIYVAPWFRPTAGAGGTKTFNLFDELQKAFKGVPKTRTPAFLIEGNRDAIDRGAGTPRSDILQFAGKLTRAGTPVVTLVTGSADGAHFGPFTDLKNPQINGFYDIALRYGVSTIRRR